MLAITLALPSCTSTVPHLDPADTDDVVPMKYYISDHRIMWAEFPI